MELWKDIKGYEGMYQVSNEGRVKSLDRKVKQRGGGTQNKKGQLIVESMNHKGYKLTGITKENKNRTFATHRLVAEHFIENNNEKLQVNHIDGNKTNNHVDNLEWVTASENMRHAFDTGLKSVCKEHLKMITKKANKINQKKVDQLTKDGEYIKSFDSIMEASEHVNINYRGISDCVNGNQITSAGYKWRFSET